MISRKAFKCVLLVERHHRGILRVDKYCRRADGIGCRDAAQDCVAQEPCTETHALVCLMYRELANEHDRYLAGGAAADPPRIFARHVVHGKRVDASDARGVFRWRLCLLCCLLCCVMLCILRCLSRWARGLVCRQFCDEHARMAEGLVAEGVTLEPLIDRGIAASKTRPVVLRHEGARACKVTHSSNTLSRASKLASFGSTRAGVSIASMNTRHDSRRSVILRLSANASLAALRAAR